MSIPATAARARSKAHRPMRSGPSETVPAEVASERLQVGRCTMQALVVTVRKTGP